MSEKVKLTKAQADALEYTKSLSCYRNISIIVKAHDDDWAQECAPLNGLPLDTLIRALYIGYKVETPEDKVRELFDNPDGRHDAFRDGIILTLEALGIKIEGVNK